MEKSFFLLKVTIYLITIFSLVGTVMKKTQILILLFAGLLFGGLTNALQAQTENVRDTSIQDVLPFIEGDDPIVAMMDSLLSSEFFRYYCYSTDTVLLNLYEYESGFVPTFSDSEYNKRMELLDRETPLELIYNPTVKGFIDLYAVRKRALTSRVMGLSHVYFPLFEEALQRHNMPLELKYLAVVESALNPGAISRVGAAGLWQFMYPTGKMYDLQVDSYCDQRMDPALATDAACKYLSFLYGMYDDWNLALAAYNSGPGNVNKAIRRSGGKRDFWEIKSFLPKETQGYVPAFIAVNYVMNYASEHNIYPEIPAYTYFECDTLHIKHAISFDQISAYTGMTSESIAELNPVYRKGYIPCTNGNQHLRLPVDRVGVFMSNEANIYDFKPAATANVPEEIIAPAKVESDKLTYKVKSGDMLGKIADRHGVTVSNIMKWNNLRNTTITPGQQLVIYSKNPPSTADKSSTSNASTGNNTAAKHHTVKKGESLWIIADKYKGVSLDDLRQLNKGKNLDKLQPGQKIIISKHS